MGMKFFEPFQISLKIREVTYHLNLPAGTKIHLVFHISLLKQCVSDLSLTTLPLPLMHSSLGPLIFPTTILKCKDVLRGWSAGEACLDSMAWVSNGGHFLGGFGSVDYSIPKT